MPLYEIQHILPLGPTQKDDIAQAITTIHSTKFVTPKLFVNVNFTDVSKADAYVGGVRQTQNSIRAYVRSGPSRTQKDWDEICQAIEKAWYQIVGEPVKQSKVNGAGLNTDKTLRAIFVIGGIIGGLEAGFPLPPAGGDVQWMHENWEEFNKRADEGNEDMIGMVKEIKERGLMDGTNGTMSAKQRLEEMLGWGDAA